MSKKKYFGNPYEVSNSSRQLLANDLPEKAVENELKTVFVYCDLVSSRPVEDVMVPLLRAVPVMEKSSNSVFRIYDKPHYISLTRFSFDTVEILLTDDLGQMIAFTSGTSVLTLHFRTRKNFDLP